MCIITLVINTRYSDRYVETSLQTGHLRRRQLPHEALAAARERRSGQCPGARTRGREPLKSNRALRTCRPKGFMNLYICICRHLCMLIRIYVYSYLDMGTYLNVCVPMYVCLFVCLFVRLLMYTHVHAHSCTHISIPLHM